MINHAEIEAKRREIDAIRRIETHLATDAFTLGHLAGIQQALCWILGVGMEPISATLTQAQHKRMREILDG